MFIYKFQDHIDFDCAFVVASTTDEAIDIIRVETKLDITVTEHYPLEDFPTIASKMDGNPGIYKNNINPF